MIKHKLKTLQELVLSLAGLTLACVVGLSGCNDGSNYSRQDPNPYLKHQILYDNYRIGQLNPGRYCQPNLRQGPCHLPRR